MNAKDSIHVVNCLSRLKERYLLRSDEIKQLENLKNHSVTSIAFTENGGFDKKDGDYHSEERSHYYKIRIKYRLHDSEPEKILVLMPGSESPD